MADDFLRLVSQSNPAARQYQPTHNGYPPSAAAGPYSNERSPQVMDPFFDDEDDNIPDSAFGRPAPMQSQESGLPLARSAAPPAGVGGSTTGLPQGWNFDDDELQPSNGPAFQGSSAFNGSKSSQDKAPKAKSRKWTWPWKKEKVVTGERVIALNSPGANTEFCSNFVSTSKYNLASFVPKFLFGMYWRSSGTVGLLSSEQFSKYANLFFLFTAFIQQIPGVSPTNRYTTIAPLAVVLLASAFKEVQEDLVRHPFLKASFTY